jgi:hypothetical protein
MEVGGVGKSPEASGFCAQLGRMREGCVDMLRHRN